AAVADATLAADVAAMRAAARAIDPTKTVAQVYAELPDVTPESVIAQATQDVADLRRFVIEHRIVTVAFDDVPTVAETPPFMRTNFAFFNSSGPFDPHPSGNYFFVTPAEPSWPRERQVAYLGKRAGLLYTTVHEVWPGHFVQSLVSRKLGSRVMRSLWNGPV